MDSMAERLIILQICSGEHSAQFLHLNVAQNDPSKEKSEKTGRRREHCSQLHERTRVTKNDDIPLFLFG